MFICQMNKFGNFRKEIYMNNNKIRYGSTITGCFSYFDEYNYVSLPDIHNEMPQYENLLKKFGFEVISSETVTNTSFSTKPVKWHLKLPYFKSHISLIVGDESLGKDILFTFEMNTHTNGLTENQEKWLMFYLMDIFVYRSNNSSRFFKKKLLLNSPFTFDLEWSTY